MDQKCIKILEIVGITDMVLSIAFLVSIQLPDFAPISIVLTVYGWNIAFFFLGLGIWKLSQNIETLVETSLVYQEVRKYGDKPSLNLLLWCYQISKDYKDWND